MVNRFSLRWGCPWSRKDNKDGCLTFVWVLLIKDKWLTGSRNVPGGHFWSCAASAAPPWCFGAVWGSERSLWVPGWWTWRTPPAPAEGPGTLPYWHTHLQRKPHYVVHIKVDKPPQLDLHYGFLQQWNHCVLVKDPSCFCFGRIFPEKNHMTKLCVIVVWCHVGWVWLHSPNMDVNTHRHTLNQNSAHSWLTVFPLVVHSSCRAEPTQWKTQSQAQWHISYTFQDMTSDDVMQCSSLVVFVEDPTLTLHLLELGVIGGEDWENPLSFPVAVYVQLQVGQHSADTKRTTM